MKKTANDRRLLHLDLGGRPGSLSCCTAPELVVDVVVGVAVRTTQFAHFARSLRSPERSVNTHTTQSLHFFLPSFATRNFPGPTLTLLPLLLLSLPSSSRVSFFGPQRSFVQGGSGRSPLRPSHRWAQVAAAATTTAAAAAGGFTLSLSLSRGGRAAQARTGGGGE